VKCQVVQSTDASSITLTRPQAPFTPVITGTPAVCINDNANYLVNGDDIGTVIWSVSPVTESISGNGTSATANYKEAGSKTVTADVTSASCPAKKATLSTTTTVNDKPAIPVITPLPVTLNKNSSPFELTIAPEEGIVVFSGRGVIGNMLYPDSLLCDTDNTIMCGVTNGCGTSSGSINARVACCAIKIHGQDTVCAKDTLIKHGYNVTGTEISDSVTWTLNKYLKKVLTPKADSAYLQLTSGTIDSVTLYASVSAQCKDSINIFSAPIPIFVFNGPKVDTICVLSGIGLNFSVYKSTWPVTIQYFDGNGNLLPDQENGAVTVYGSPNTNIYTVHAFDGHCFDTTFTTTVYRHQAPDAWFETTQSCVGDTIEMKIYARDLNNCGYNWFRFFLNYDSTAMQYVNFSMKNSITPNSSWVTINGKGGQLQAYIMSYLGGAFTITSSASLLTTLKFIAKKAGNNVNISLDSLTFCGLPKFNLYDSTITIGKATVATGDITGKDTLCWNTQDEVYSIAPGNDLPSRWKLSPSNAGTIQSNGRSASYTTAVGFGGTVDLQAVYDATTCSPTITLHKSITVFSRPAVLNYNVDTEWQCPETVGDGYIGYYIDPDSLINYTVWNANHTIVSNSQFFDYAPSTVPNQVDKYTFEISHRYCTLPTIYDSIYLARYPLPMASASAQPVCQSDTLRVVVSLADIHNCEYQDVNFSAFFDEANYRFAAVSLEGSLLNNNWYNHISTTTTHFVGGENIQIHFNNLSMSVPVTPGTFATLLFVPLKTGTTTIHINDVVYNSAETLTNAVAQIDVPVTVYPNPVISIADGSICQGSTFTLAPVVTGGTMPYSYIWSNASLQSSIPVSSAGNYRITVSDSHGCKANTSAHVAVLPSPTVTTQTGQSTICRGTSATISVTGAASYTWSNGSTKTLITITPSVSTTYTVTGTNASGCSNTATATLTVNPVPTVTVTGGALNGGSYTLTATATGNSPLGYKWSNTSTNSNTDAVTLPGTYTVTVNDANGCQSSASGTVTIFRSITDVCSYQPGVNLNAGNFATYQWSGPSLSANTTWNPVWVATSGTYTVVTTDANGKTYTATTTVVIHPTYSPTVTANVNGTVTTIGNGGTITTCPGIPVTLNANAGEVQYLWNNGTSQNATYTTGTVGNITLSEIDQYGCTSTTVYMNLQNYNVPQAVITQSDIITGSNNVSFTINDGNFTSFVWSTGATTRSITINSPGTYSVTATTANGCQSVTTITEALNTVPLSIIKQTATTGITLVAQSLYSDYRWYNVNTSSAIGGGGTITVTNAGTYRVDEYYNGIKVATATVVVALDASTGKLKSDVISEEDNTTPSVGSSIVSPTLAEVTNTVTVIPQPAKNEVRVVSTSPVKMVTMYDMNGKVVISTKSITVIDISILPSGTYQMVIETEAGIFNRTVVVMK